ncbi:RICIN domain-containing protein [Archangium lansingense]|uniref:M12 family metallopeptidase n=1 Tax=Archangium lansingense TaxID=2995310 RepID=A0ABT4AJM3_9BACT|nr:RICIN domain-containing protein [Archangium lansinium]MCY1081486.1 M12 family metallopeptidase [Archangium lansinium]
MKTPKKFQLRNTLTAASLGMLAITTQAGCGGAVEESETEELPSTFGGAELAYPGRTGVARTGMLRTERGELQVSYEEIDGNAVIDGDIVMPLHLLSEPGERHASGTARSYASTRWPNGVVPYVIDSGLSSPSRVTDAIAHWTEKTNIKFVARTNETDYVRFVSGSGCSSSVGKVGGAQNITLESGCSTGNAIHEIGHALGVWHEQMRSDRDNYVTINWSNIQSGYSHNFQTYTASGYDGLDVGAYDYGSIMHYSRNAFGINGAETITPRTSGVTIGQRDGLSSTDLETIRTIYDGVTEFTNISGWWGSANAGGGVAITQLDSDSRPDMIVFHVDDPSGGNNGHYRIGWNIDKVTLANGAGTKYRPTNWSGPTSIGGWWGNTTSGAGIAVGDINGNGRPDLVVVHVDNPDGADGTHYRIGWDLTTSGSVSSWSGPYGFSGGFHGSRTQGADVALYDLNGNGKLDMVVGTVDDASGGNAIYYSVGWDLSSSGGISSYSGNHTKTGWVGNTTQEMGLDVADMDGNGKPDIVISWVDALSGDDVHVYQVGYDLSSSTGAVSSGWSGSGSAMNTAARTLNARVGEHTQGADVAVYDFNNDGSKDLLGFHIDHVNDNTGYLSVLMDQSDKLYSFAAKHSGQFMDIVNDDTHDGARLQQWPWGNGDNQKFSLRATGDGYYFVVARSSGKCLDIGNSSTADGAAVQQWSWNGNDNQKFSLVSHGDGYYSLKAKHSGKCLDVFAFSQENGGEILQWFCNGYDNQKFTMTRL